MLASLRDKSLTSDEIVHATAGYTYWKFNDYRLNPENGNLPQRIMALPLLWGFRFPSTESAAWRTSDEWAMGDEWFHRMGNDASSMLARGRAASGLMAVALGALVWLWSRRLFGPMGGLVSLLLFVLSPTILANGALMTSDTACGLFFLAATFGWWSALQRVSFGSLVGSALAMGGLFVSKMSASLILPMAAIMLVARLIDGRPLPVTIGRPRTLLRRHQQAAAFVAVGLVHAAVVLLVIWSCFGFRYLAFADARPGLNRFNDTWEHITDKPLLPVVLDDLRLTPAQNAAVRRLLIDHSIPVNKWTPEALAFIPVIEKEALTTVQARQFEEEMAAPPPARLPRLLVWLNHRHWLPEAYLFGQAFSLKFTQKRGAFFNGEFGLFGWWSFFPYTVLVKTPLPVFGIAILALMAVVATRRLAQLGPGPRRPGGCLSLYDTLPLWTLLGCYGAALMASHINIGHRHILAVYPPFFVLCGAAAGWWDCASAGAAPRWLARGMNVALSALLLLLGAEVLSFFPNYLAYFNVIAGGPKHAYRHLVDSSLDWGQDLPGVKRYIEEKHPPEPCYLAYFGSASPAYYRIPAHLLFSLSQPTLLVSAPVARAEAAVADALRDHPDFQVAASGERDGQAAIMLLQNVDTFRLRGGTYFISATKLQPLDHDPPGPWGPWNDRYEAKYQELLRLARPFLSNNPADRVAALQEGSVYLWMEALNDFAEFRFARLTAYLRRREPDDTVGYSILVYHLTDADLERALEGPPPESGPDVLRILEASHKDAATP